MRKRKFRLWIPILVVLALLLSGAAPAMANSGEAPSRYIVVTEPGVDPAAVARGRGLSVAHIYTHALSGFAAPLTPAQLEALAADPRVSYVEPDRMVYALGQTLPTGVDRIEVDQNDTANINNEDDTMDVDIAIIDTGIDKDHPDLNVHTGRNFSTGPDWKWDDGNGHGTHVAGTAAAIDNGIGVVGVAPGARLWAVKVLGDDGSGWMSDIIAGVDWVTDNADEIEVANMSLGGGGVSDSFRTAIQNSVDAGVVHVVAAGNDDADVYGSDGNFGTDDDKIPAAYPEAATISAMADSDGQPGGDGGDTSYGPDDSFASFSNYSRSVVSDNPVESPGAAIDLLLPGVDIYSTYKDGGYNTLSGTSMASPHGAGLAALYIAENGRANDADDVYAIRQALIDNGVAQDSTDGLATPNDPDSNPENIGWAGNDTTDAAPTVSWENPTDGEEISGTVTIQIDASDTEDDTGALTVDWRVDDGDWDTTTYNSDSGYYEETWDSTAVSDGEHNLDARAEDSDGNTATASITVTTENTDNAPSVSWVNPQDGDTVKDTVTIQIEARDDRDSGSELTVQWQVDDGNWYTATYDSDCDCYTDTWKTTDVDDGDYTLKAQATDTGNNTSSEEQITVTVSNETAGDMYVGDISWREIGPHLKATVSILVDSNGDGADADDDPVSDATVNFTLNLDSDGDGSYDDDSQSYSDTTDSAGQVEFMWKRAPSGKYEGEVVELSHTDYTWDKSLDKNNPATYEK